MSFTNATTGFGTRLSSGDGGTASTITIGGAGDSGLLFTAREAGVSGDSIAIEAVVTQTTPNTTVSVSGTTITIDLASSDGTTSIATAQEVLTAVRSSVDADALVKVANVGNGSGVFAAAASANLSGGVDEIYTLVAEVTNIDGPSFEQSPLDVSHMTSPGGWREFIASGLKDPGELSLEMNFLPSSPVQQKFFDDFTNSTETNYRIQWTDELNTTWQLGGIITSLNTGASPDSQLTASATIKITKQPIFNAGA